MSFDFKGSSNIRPMIQETQQMKNNGGGGNLGYFKREKKEENHKQNETIDLFEGPEDDSFEHKLEIEGEENKNDFSSIKNWFNNLIKKIKKPFINKRNPFA